MLVWVSCSSNETTHPPVGPTINGQVVDIETCFTRSGCQGVLGARVSFFHDTRYISGPTSPDGGYTMSNVPVGVHDLALVTDSGNTGELLTVLQTVYLGSSGSDVYGVELYAMRRTGGLYAAMAKQAGVDVATNALYFGVASVLENNTMAAVSFATATTNPPGQVHFVNCTPFVKDPPCSEPLFDGTRTSTGPLGAFLVVAPSRGQLSVQLNAAGRTFDPVQAPVGTGYLTLGVHKGRGNGSVDGGTPDRGNGDAGKLDRGKLDRGKLDGAKP